MRSCSIRRRKLLSIGYDVEAGKVHAACYDLLASEARIAAFISVAKGDIPQESWFQMSRSHVVVEGPPGADLVDGHHV